MPQMKPLNWLILFIYFIVILIMISIMNYYIILYTPTSFLKNKLLMNHWIENDYKFIQKIWTFE